MTSTESRLYVSTVLNEGVFTSIHLSVNARPDTSSRVASCLRLTSDIMTAKDHRLSQSRDLSVTTKSRFGLERHSSDAVLKLLVLFHGDFKLLGADIVVVLNAVIFFLKLSTHVIQFLAFILPQIILHVFAFQSFDF